VDVKIRPGNASALQVQDGAQRNSGVEPDIKANPFKRLNHHTGSGVVERQIPESCC